MKKFWILILGGLLSFPAMGIDGPFIRGYAAERAYFQMFAMPTFYQSPVKLGGGYPGLTTVPYLGFEGGVGVMIPFRFHPEGRIFQYSADMVSGINPVSVNIDINGAQFFLDLDKYEKIRFNNSYFSIRQTLYWHKRVSRKVVGRMGVGIGARTIRRKQFSRIYWEDSQSGSPPDLRLDFKYEQEKSSQDWTGGMDIQLIKGWEWITPKGGFYGFDLLLNLNYNKTLVYNYTLASIYRMEEGRIELRTHFIGIRLVAGLSGFSKERFNDIRFPD